MKKSRRGYEFEVRLDGDAGAGSLDDDALAELAGSGGHDPRWLARLARTLVLLDAARAAAGARQRGQGADVIELHYDREGRPRLARVRVRGRPLDTRASRS